MHLKSDNRIFVLPIALGVVLAIPLVLIVTLAVSHRAALPGGGGQTSGANGATSQSGPTSVDVTETSFKISLHGYVPAGKVSFHVTNQADAVPHQFVVIQTDTAPGQLPTANGKVDTSNLNVVGKTDNIQAAQRRPDRRSFRRASACPDLQPAQPLPERHVRRLHRAGRFSASDGGSSQTAGVGNGGATATGNITTTGTITATSTVTAIPPVADAVGHSDCDAHGDSTDHWHANERSSADIPIRSHVGGRHRDELQDQPLHR
ncbi:MAG: hypothetical protein R3A10_04450 [Caldilineaceae bacterium]